MSLPNALSPVVLFTRTSAPKFEPLRSRLGLDASRIIRGAPLHGRESLRRRAERPLAPRGRKAAKKMAKELQRREIARMRHGSPPGAVATPTRAASSVHRGHERPENPHFAEIAAILRLKRAQLIT